MTSQIKIDPEHIFEVAHSNLSQVFLEDPAKAKDWASAIIFNPEIANLRLAFLKSCLLYTSPSPRDQRGSRMPSSA